MENKYYVIELETMTDGTAPKAVYEYPDSTQAGQIFHQKMASAMSNENVMSALCMVINAYGAVVRSELYKVDEPEDEGEL